MEIKNHNAYRDWNIIETKEAGIALKGSEVKSIKAGQASLDGALIHFREGEAYLVNAHISPWQSHPDSPDPKRDRRLLLKKKEILAWQNKINQEKLTPIPLKWYNKAGLIKLKIGLGKRKKKGGKGKTTLKSREYRV